MSGADH